MKISTTKTSTLITRPNFSLPEKYWNISQAKEDFLNWSHTHLGFKALYDKFHRSKYIPVCATPQTGLIWNLLMFVKPGCPSKHQAGKWSQQDGFRKWKIHLPTATRLCLLSLCIILQNNYRNGIYAKLKWVYRSNTTIWGPSTWLKYPQWGKYHCQK